LRDQDDETEEGQEGRKERSRGQREGLTLLKVDVNPKYPTAIISAKDFRESAPF
jgi:hypothetical protein